MTVAEEYGLGPAAAARAYLEQRGNRAPSDDEVREAIESSYMGGDVSPGEWLRDYYEQTEDEGALFGFEKPDSEELWEKEFELGGWAAFEVEGTFYVFAP